MEKFRRVAIINDTTGDVGVEGFYPLLNVRSKVNDCKVLFKKFQSSESKAFLKSMKMARPGMFSRDVTFIISWYKSDVLSDISPLDIPCLIVVYDFWENFR